MKSFSEWQATRQRVTAESNPALFAECHGVNLDGLMVDEVAAVAYHVYEYGYFIGEEAEPLTGKPVFTLFIENQSWENGLFSGSVSLSLERKLYHWLKDQDYCNSFAS